MNWDGSRNLVDLVKQHGGADLVGSKSGISASTLKKWMSGNTEPKVGGLLAVARALGVTVEEIVNGPTESDRAGLIGFAESIADLDPPTIYIRRLDVGLSAGAGGFADDVPELAPVPFAADVFSKTVGGRNPENMVIVHARGDSMVPTLGDGDLVMIDTTDIGRAEGLFAVALGDELYVKRLSIGIEGSQLLSDNRAYPPVTLTSDQLATLKIIGRVVWVGHSL